jgi:PhnB protein
MALVGGHQPGQVAYTLVVKDPVAAAEFYREVLAGEEIFRHRMLWDEPGLAEGTVLCIEMVVGGARFRVEREQPGIAMTKRKNWPLSPETLGGISSKVSLFVDDVDAVMTRALACGAKPTADGVPIGKTVMGDRAGQFVDPQGHCWRILACVEQVAFEDLPRRCRELADATRT